MPNVPPRMSPFALKRTGIPSNDTPILVRLICVRTSARLAVPFLQARSTARPITWAATYDGAPKYSPLPPCDRWYARTVLSFALTGKNESYAPLIAANRHARRPQLRLHDVGETSRVSLLVVDDVDALELQPLDDEVRDGGTLNAIGRNGSEEEAGSRPVGRERGVRRRARYEAEPRVLDRRRGRLHLVRAARAGRRKRERADEQGEDELPHADSPFVGTTPSETPFGVIGLPRRRARPDLRTGGRRRARAAARRRRSRASARGGAAGGCTSRGRSASAPVRRGAGSLRHRGRTQPRRRCGCASRLVRAG